MNASMTVNSAAQILYKLVIPCQVMQYLLSCHIHSSPLFRPHRSKPLVWFWLTMNKFNMNCMQCTLK